MEDCIGKSSKQYSQYNRYDFIYLPVDKGSKLIVGDEDNVGDNPNNNNINNTFIIITDHTF